MSDNQQDLYAESLVDLLSDVVDTLNEARADGLVFNFQISDIGGKFVLSSLTATKPIALPGQLPQSPTPDKLAQTKQMPVQ